ncbi:MAG: M43 family zinc metalloprotease, partial [Bacteroidota bacterium]|nr:M43 family zinc metalloprotease [Bacteroidota bacterium]
MKYSIYIFCAVLFLYSSNLQAQERNCVTTEYNLQLLNDNPEFGQKLVDLEQATNHYSEILSLLSTTSEIYTIPIVVHVLYNSDSENILDDQIFSQIDSLNKDFRAQNADISTVPDAFQPVVADVGIEFCFASVDPQGNPTDGINRVFTSTTSFSYSGNDMKFSSSGGVDAWNTSDYLNIWVCNMNGGILGFAQFPGGSAATDGVVVDYEYFGSIGSATYPYNLGRTLTHEVGHWLNLRHIWGDSYCGDDFVDDTPTQETSNGGCQTFPHVTCNNGPNGDMFMNYMDYSYDSCLTMFTTGQKNRMIAALTTSRSSLLDSDACSFEISGCTDPSQFNFDSLAEIDDGSCIPFVYGCMDSTQYNYNPFANFDDQSCIPFILGCIDNTQFNFNPIANTNDDSCIPYIYGCTDETQFNFDSLANTNDGSCIPFIFGCIDNTQFNFNPLANTNDDSCIPYIYGCTDETQFNFDSLANTNDGSCLAFVYGCNDSLANNFNSLANTNDGSCEYDCKNVNLSVTTDFWGYETSWTLTNEQGSIDSISVNSYDNQTTYNYSYCLLDGCYEFSISDTYGDGIEGYDNNPNDDGFYSITNNSGDIFIQLLIPNFGTNETQTFCVEIIEGCTDVLAVNFDSNADIDDGSCQYQIDFCELAPVGDNWQSLSSYSAESRHHPITFSSNRYGFVMAGNTASGTYLKDVHRYDSQTDSWEQLADFPGNPTGFGYGVSNGNKAYVGFGRNSTSYNTDWWEYDINNDFWTQLASFPSDGRIHPAMVLVTNRVYMGMGNNSSGNLNDWWEYNIDTDEWIQHADFPHGARHHPFYFDIGDYAYVGFGHGNSINNNYNIHSDFYRYQHENDSWTEIAAFPAEGRVAGTQFSFNGKGYVLSGDGDNHSYMECGQFWKYNPEINNWTQLESHPGYSRWAPGSFVINCDVYFTSGYDRQTTTLHNDLYSFSLSQNCGCTDLSANNYDPNATEDDGSCIYTILGCTDPTADNFDPLANADDSSC